MIWYGMMWYDRMCAGATVFSPLSRFRVSSTNYSRIAVVGVGGLGHLAIQFAAALGATVTAISTSETKRADAMKLGAKHYISIDVYIASTVTTTVRE